MGPFSGCKIILFPLVDSSWTQCDESKAPWKCFESCLETSESERRFGWRRPDLPLWKQRLERPDLKITVSKTDAHPGKENNYHNACSLYAIITDKSPVGLPATLEMKSADSKMRWFAIASDAAEYLQKLAWKVYKREIENTKPAK